MESVETKSSADLEKSNALREAQSKKPRTKRDENSAEWRKLKKIRLARKANRRAILKSAGMRPNKKLTRDKKTGKEITDEFKSSLPNWNALVEVR